MYSQRTIALKRYSTLTFCALIVWAVAATVLTVMWQLPVYVTPLVWLGILACVWLRHLMPMAQLAFDEEGAWYQQGSHRQFAQLLYRNDYWLVVTLSSPLEPSFNKRVFFYLLARHKLIFRDQFQYSDYRYTRARLSAAKFMNESAPKNEF